MYSKLFEEVYARTHLYEMGTTLRKRDTGLPVNIWIDDMAWKKSSHWKRIKFQPDTGDKSDTRTFVSMSIDDEPEVLTRRPQLSIDSKKLEQIRQFVRLNKDLLLLYSDQKISISEFLAQMKRAD